MKEVNLPPEIVFTIVLYENLIGEQFTFIYLEEDTYCFMQKKSLYGTARVISPKLLEVPFCFKNFMLIIQMIQKRLRSIISGQYI
jgi:hypothetical protein